MNRTDDKHTAWEGQVQDRPMSECEREREDGEKERGKMVREREGRW